MVLPIIHIDISGTAVAFYAAVLATITATVQIANFFRDRTRLRVKVFLNQLIIGDPSRDPNQTLIRINVTNVGRRPVTLIGINVARLFPCETHFLLLDIMPRTPCELTEGKYAVALVPQDKINLAEIRSWEASTSGRTFRCHQASWRKRLISDWKWKRHFTKEAKKKAATQKGN